MATIKALIDINSKYGTFRAGQGGTLPDDVAEQWAGFGEVEIIPDQKPEAEADELSAEDTVTDQQPEAEAEAGRVRRKR